MGKLNADTLALIEEAREIVAGFTLEERARLAGWYLRQAGIDAEIAQCRAEEAAILKGVRL